MVTTTGTLAKTLQEGVEEFFGSSYARFPREFEDIYDIVGSQKAFEERVETVNIGLAPVKNEGAATTYVDRQQGDTYRSTHVAYSIGMIITKEAIDDNLYMQDARDRSEAVARSMSNTENVVAMLPLNRAFNASYPRADGVSLCNTAHPTAVGATQSNRLSADLSHASLEDAVILAEKTEANDGTPIMVMSECLIVPTDLKLTANKILQSVNESGTANNDINVLRALNSFPGGVKAKRFLTSADAWFVQTNIGMPAYYDRQAPTPAEDVEFDSGNFKIMSYMRNSQNWYEFRNIIGSQPA